MAGPDFGSDGDQHFPDFLYRVVHLPVKSLSRYQVAFHGILEVLKGLGLCLIDLVAVRVLCHRSAPVRSAESPDHTTINRKTRASLFVPSPAHVGHVGNSFYWVVVKNSDTGFPCILQTLARKAVLCLSLRSLAHVGLLYVMPAFFTVSNRNTWGPMPLLAFLGLWRHQNKPARPLRFFLVRDG